GLPSGLIAFSQADIDGSKPQVGFLAPDNSISYVNVPGADPIGVTVGPDGEFWVAEVEGTRSVTKFAPGQTPVSVSPGFSTDFHPRQIAPGPEHTLWVTLTPSNALANGAVGRISGVEKPSMQKPSTPPSVSVAPQTMLGKGPAKVIQTNGKRARVK